MLHNKKISFTLSCLLTLAAASQSFAQTVAMPFVKKGAAQFQIQALSTDPALTYTSKQIAEILPHFTSSQAKAPTTAWPLKLAVNHSALKAADLPHEKLGDDGYLIVKDGNGLLITGYTGRAVLYGVFDLMRQATGYAWTRPQAGSTPASPISDATLNLTLPYTSQPAFEERGMSLSYMQWKTDNTNMLDWLARNGMNMNGLITPNYKEGATARLERGFPLHIHGHAFGFLVSPGEFGKTHPEYFSLVDGKRKIVTRNSQLCTSNPEVVALVASRFEKMLQEQPALQTLGLAPNDGSSGWCQCPNCEAQDAPGDANQPLLHGKRSYSTRYIKFANQVAARLKKKHPNVRLHVYAYTNYIAPPETEVDPALEVEFCAMYRCTVHALNDAACPRNAAFNRYLQGWLPKTKNIFVRDYFLMMGSNAARATPTSLYTLQKDLQYYQSQNLKGLVPEMIADGPNGANVPDGEEHAAWLRTPSSYTETWDNGWLVYYGMTRLLWNPQQSVSDFIKQACTSYYGPAGELMAQYHDRLQKNWYGSGRPGEMPPADKITTFSENVQSGPYCLGWGYAPRITWQANHLFNIQSDIKTTKADLLKLAQLLLDARETARTKKLPLVRDRIETDVQLFQTWALAKGYEIDFRQGQTQAKFMSTEHE